MAYCSNCGTLIEANSKFCKNCGSPTDGQLNSASSNVVNNQIRENGEREKVFYRGEGTLVIKRTQARSAGRKVASWLALGPIGYVAFGRDKKSKSKASGELIVTNKAIYCAGNDYPFDRLISLTRHGGKTVVITFEKDVAPGGQTDKGVLGMGGLSIEAEIKTESKNTCNELFDGLQRARTSHLAI